MQVFSPRNRRSPISTANQSGGLIKSGSLMKRRYRSGFYARRWIELRGGFLYWWKMDALGSRNSCSSRFLPGCSIQGDSQSENGEFTGQIMIFIVTAPGEKSPPLLFSLDSESEYTSWLSAFREAADWRFFRKLSSETLRDRLAGVLVLEAVRGEGLKVADWGGTSDPYLTVEFDGIRVRTKTVYQTIDPEWNEALMLPIYHDDPNWTVAIYAYDEDEVSADDLLGVLCLPLHAFGCNEEKMFRLPLLDEHPKAVRRFHLGHLTFRAYFATSKVHQALPFISRPQPKSKTHTVSTFNIEVFKLQVNRVTQIAKLLSTLGKLKDIVTWRHPISTFFVYLVLSFVILFAPDLALYALLGWLLWLLVQNHPEFPNLYKRLLRPLGLVWLAPVRAKEEAVVEEGAGASPGQPTFLSQKSMGVGGGGQSGLLRIQEMPSDVEVVDSTSEDDDVFAKETIQVYECERRNVSATAAVILSRDLGSFKKTFSAKNLKDDETRWMTLAGTPFDATPKTVENGFKYAWRVRVDGKLTDVNGWEYAVRWPNNPDKWTRNFTRNFHVHMHWVRRRLWVGQVVRGATEDDQVREIGEEEADMNEVDDLDEVKTPGARGILAKYRKILEEGGKIQHTVFEVANGLEAQINWFTWRQAHITKLVASAISVAFIVAAFLPPSTLLWLGVTAVFGGEFDDFLERQKVVRVFLTAFREEVLVDKRVPDDWRKILLDASAFTPVEDLAEVNPEVIRGLLLKTSDTLKLHAKLSLKEFSDCAYLGEFVERIYRQAFGERWFLVHNREAKLGNLKVNPNNLLKGHAIHNWDKFNLFSFSRNN